MNILPGSDAAKQQILKNYCEMGWLLIPCWHRGADGICTCREGMTCNRPGKHPRIKWQYPEPGRSGASSSVDTVMEWHEFWPDANWAIALDDVFVVDVDRKHGGMTMLADMEDNAPEILGLTLVQSTYDGGRQLFYQQSEQREDYVKTISQGILPWTGFEIKGRRQDGEIGSYVLIPPSQGRTWLNDQAISEPSPFLLQAIKKVTKVVATDGADAVIGGDDAFNWYEALTPGAVLVSQDDCLYRAALSLRALKIPSRLAIPMLRVVVRGFTNLVQDDPWTIQHADVKWDYVCKNHKAGHSIVLTSEQQEAADRLIQGWLS